ncbi:MAG: RNA polymerase sporulation sigma factor SigK [Acutalibacteraceae bacterium]
MFNLLNELLNSISMLFILHVTGSGSFPKPLSEEEESELIEKSINGDIEARNKLVEHNLRLVAHIVRKYYAVSADTDDLVSIGTIGLIKAVNTFQPNKNIRLSSYASRCIENEILMYFRSTKKNSRDISLNEAIDSDSDGNNLTFMDIMCVEDHIADDLDTKLKTEKLGEYLYSVLTPRERLVIKLRYGLDGKTPLTQRETAKILGISRSYVVHRT